MRDPVIRRPPSCDPVAVVWVIDEEREMRRTADRTPTAQRAIAVRNGVVEDFNIEAFRDSLQVIDPHTPTEEASTGSLDSEDPTSRLACLGRVSVLDRVEFQVRGWFQGNGVASGSSEREIRTRL